MSVSLMVVVSVFTLAPNLLIEVIMYPQSYQIGWLCVNFFPIYNGDFNNWLEDLNFQFSDLLECL